MGPAQCESSVLSEDKVRDYRLWTTSRLFGAQKSALPIWRSVFQKDPTVESLPELSKFGPLYCLVDIYRIDIQEKAVVPSFLLHALKFAKSLVWHVASAGTVHNPCSEEETRQA